MAQTFAQVVGVLMRDPNFRNMRLADLEWLVLPPVMAGQFRLGHAMRPAGKTQQGAGISVPVAVALWARVSPDIDKGLSEALDKPVHLRPNQWASGDILWLMAAAGDPRAKPHFLKQLAETEFKGQHVKMRLRGPDGKVVVKALGSSRIAGRRQVDKHKEACDVHFGESIPHSAKRGTEGQRQSG